MRPIGLVVFLVLFSTPTDASNAIVIRYRCFTDWMTYSGSPARHVGIEVETADGYSCIENLGSGTVINPTRTVSCITNCFGKWWQPSRHTTTNDLAAAGGNGYHLVWNNCYHARNRMLERIGDGQC